MMNDESGVWTPDSSFIIQRSPTEHLVTSQKALWLENKPDFEQAMQRVEAWFGGEMLDRPPVRFIAHNAFLDSGADLAGLSMEERRARWLDPQYQVDRFLSSITDRKSVV